MCYLYVEGRSLQMPSQAAASTALISFWTPLAIVLMCSFEGE